MLDRSRGRETLQRRSQPGPVGGSQALHLLGLPKHFPRLAALFLLQVNLGQQEVAVRKIGPLCQEVWPRLFIIAA